MIGATRLLCFFLASSIEIQVHAAIVSLPNQNEIVQEPVGCLLAQSVCALMTVDGRKFETKIGTTSVLMGSNSIIVRLNQGSLLLVQGEVWVKADKTFIVRSEYGDVELADESESWLVRSEKRVLVRALNKVAQIRSRGSEDRLSLQPGFEIAFEGVTNSGHARLSIPSVLDFRDHLHRWARLYRGPRKEFVHDIHRLEPILEEAARLSSELHLEMAQRYLASEKIEIDQAEAHRRALELESARMRALFRERATR